MEKKRDMTVIIILKRYFGQRPMNNHQDDHRNLHFCTILAYTLNLAFCSGNFVGSYDK